tara:strand:+ start:2012 stop:2860 length:849 start_codon:yes stop_codon:yes gene_type:complete
MIHANYIENTKETFKRILPIFKKALKSEAKCHVGDQKAYNLIAVARGYKDFNTALGSNAHNLYSLRANLGTDSEPFFVSKALGEYASDVDAWGEVEVALMHCSKSMEWVLYRGDKKTQYTYCSEPKQSGRHLQLDIRADSLSMAVSNAKEMMDKLTPNTTRVKQTYEGGHTIAFISGKDNRDVVKKPHVEVSKKYAIVNNSGVVSESAFVDLHDTPLENGLKGSHYALSISFDELISLSEKETVAVVPVRTSKRAVFNGTPQSAVKYMKKQMDLKYLVYRLC